MSKAEQTPPVVGRLVRTAAGAWHVPAGFGFLLRRPRLWPLSLLPALLTGGLLVAGFFAGWFTIPHVAAFFSGAVARTPELLGVIITVALWLGTVAAGMAVGLALALFLSAPLLELLSARVERLITGNVPARSRGLFWEAVQAFRGALYFLAAAPAAFFISLVPLLGPPLGALWAAYALAHQLTEAPLVRRGLDFAQRRAWHRTWRAESTGFGLGGVAVLLVPFANLLLGPVLAVAGTLLVIELEGTEPPGPPEAAGDPSEPGPAATDETAGPPPQDRP